MKDLKIQKKPPTLKREHLALQNNTFLHFYMAILVHIDPDPADQNQWGSLRTGSTTLVTGKSFICFSLIVCSYSINLSRQNTYALN
jgi:hypothetical protein